MLTEVVPFEKFLVTMTTLPIGVTSTMTLKTYITMVTEHMKTTLVPLDTTTCTTETEMMTETLPILITNLKEFTAMQVF